MKNTFDIDLLHCKETNVFIMTSEDIPGLVLEAETLGDVMNAFIECAPRLIKTNLKQSVENCRFQFQSKLPDGLPYVRSLSMGLSEALSA